MALQDLPWCMAMHAFVLRSRSACYLSYVIC